MSRVTRAMTGGSQKVMNDYEGDGGREEGGGGSQYPPKNDDVIYEQPHIIQNQKYSMPNKLAIECLLVLQWYEATEFSLTN